MINNSNTSFQSARRIPNYIYTGFPDINYLDELFQKNFDRIKELNPNYSHTIFSNSMQVDFIEENFDKDILASYLSIDESYGAARADLFRILLLFKKGGIWLDSKSTVTSSFDRIITDSDRLVLSNWTKWNSTAVIRVHKNRNYKEIVNWFIASEPSHEILDIAIHSILSNIRRYSPLRCGIGKKAALCTTGPIAFTNAIHDKLNSNNHRIINSYDAGIRFTIFKTWEGHANYIPNNYRTSRRPLVHRNMFINSLVLIPVCLTFLKEFKNLIKNNSDVIIKKLRTLI